MNLRSVFVLLALLVGPSSLALAQGEYRPIEQRLTVEQMRATGLDRLSTEQLTLLNRLLGDEHVAQADAIREQVETKAEQERASSQNVERQPIVSKIVGEFRGWSSGSQFQLDNGQRWRVTGTSDYYVRKADASNAPAVVIMPGMVGGWYMQVEGHQVKAKVQQVR